MLITSNFYFLTTFVILACVFLFINLFFKRNFFIFVKIWSVLFYFLFLILVLGLFGEDFFIVFALATEMPIFFGFFFFFISKNQLHEVQEKSKKPKRPLKILLFTALFIACLLTASPLNPATRFNFYHAHMVAQRSDFYIYYFTYLLTNPQLIIFVGILISAMTLILILLTFTQQMKGVQEVISKKTVLWTKTQNINLQAKQKGSVLFFKI